MERIAIIVTLIVVIPCWAYIIVMMIESVKLRFAIKRRIKPVDCVSCLTFWMFILIAGFAIPEPWVFIFASPAFIIGAILDRYV